MKLHLKLINEINRLGSDSQIHNPSNLSANTFKKILSILTNLKPGSSSISPPSNYFSFLKNIYKPFSPQSKNFESSASYSK